MQRRDILRTLLFVCFFSIGVAALSGSILCDELLRHYTNRQLLREAEETLSRLESLNTDYGLLLQQLEEDPNLVKRIAPATLGVQDADGNAVYPRASAEQLTAARKALTEGANPPAAGEPAVPGWIVRCNRPTQRVVLFLAGGSLVLISFVCFGTTKEKSQRQK
jgi:cell division protein FtsL